jgi:hypothetical protein
MYWRIKKITPEIVMRQYGVHAILIVSVIGNIFLFTRVSASHAMSTTQKLDYDKFARQVTNHLFDASYITVDDSMAALEKELGPQAKGILRKMEIIPKDADDLKAISRQLLETKSVSCVKFEEVNVGQPTAQGFLPVDVKMQVVVHDTSGVRPTPMKLRYYCGQATNKQTNESYPVVVDLKQLDMNAPGGGAPAS